jgi:fructose PTS system EIIBC or EIIC component
MRAVTVNLDLAAPDAAEAIRQLAGSLAGVPGVADVERLTADVLARETVVPTFLGHGLALPHARTDAVTARVVAIGRCEAGVPFGAQGELARLIVLIGCPRREVNAYLAFSKELLGRLRQGTTREQLLATRDPAQFLKLLGLDEATSAAGVAAP